MIELSACLLCWRRHYHLPAVIDHLSRFEQVAEIVVWFNEHAPDVDLQALLAHHPFRNIRWQHSPDNLCTLGRFMAVRMASYDDVLVQDDDLLVNNIPALVEEYERIGRAKIVANLPDQPLQKRNHWTWWQVNKPPYVELGFGSIFPREWIHSLPDWPDDEDLLRRKADKVFTILNPWTAVHAVHEDVMDLHHDGQSSGHDANALWKRSDHKALTDLAVQRALEWKRRNSAR